MTPGSPSINTRVPQYLLNHIDSEIEKGNAVSRSEWVMQALLYKYYSQNLHNELLVSIDHMFDKKFQSPENAVFLKKLVAEIIQELDDSKETLQ